MENCVLSTIQTEFEGLYNRLRCKDTNVWEQLHVIADDDPLAQAMLAIGYHRNYFKKDLERSDYYGRKCIIWLQLQRDKNSLFCLGVFHHVGIVVEEDTEQAIRYYSLGSELGSHLCCCSLGYCLEVMKGDFITASSMYLSAAHSGYSQAQYNLSNCYLRGIGVERDWKLSQQWCRLAAEQGHVEAMHSLGYVHYGYEYYSHADFIEALEWFQKAADAGHPGSMNCLGIMYEHGHGTVASGPDSVHWYTLAAQKGDTSAEFNLGLCYEHGRNGFAVDLRAAQKMYALAKEKGEGRAETALRNVEKRLNNTN